MGDSRSEGVADVGIRKRFTITTFRNPLLMALTASQQSVVAVYP